MRRELLVFPEVPVGVPVGRCAQGSEDDAMLAEVELLEDLETLIDRAEEEGSRDLSSALQAVFILKMVGVLPIFVDTFSAAASGTVDVLQRRK